MTRPPRPDAAGDGRPGPTAMSSSERARLAGSVLLALRSVAPAAVLATLSALLGQELGARDLQLYLTDYRMLALHQVDSSGPGAREGVLPQPMQGSPAGRVFLTQQPVTEPAGDRELSVLVPVTVRGQRLGVLRGLLPGDGDRAGDLTAALGTTADVLAHVVVEASVGSDVFEVTRRSARFTVAAEMQWQLLPGRAIDTPAYTLAGQLEPAPYVQGDAFDWSADSEALTLCAVHVSGRGQSAALLSTLAVTALRNARRAETGLADQARLADQAVYAEHGGDRHASALLMRIGPDGGAEVVDAGSPALLLWRDGSGERVRLEAQLPLGMFDDTPYVAQQVQLRTGDRVLIATPGALEAVGADGEAFGERGLLHQLELTRDLTPQEVTRRVIEALTAHQGESLTSDASVLCLDWRGAAT